MPKIEINPEYCKACELCIPVCPKSVIALGTEANRMGYHTAVPDEEKGCIGCKMCAVMCPEGAITVYK